MAPVSQRKNNYKAQFQIGFKYIFIAENSNFSFYNWEQNQQKFKGTDQLLRITNSFVIPILSTELS